MRAYKDIDHFDNVELSTLIDNHEGPCVSFFLPLSAWLDHGGQAVPLHLRALVAQAEQQLITQGMPATVVEQLLAPVANLAAPNRKLWAPQPHDLALFVAPDRFLFYRLPLSLPELVMVDQRFYITPLLPMIDGNECFYLLTLSQNTVRLWQGTRTKLTEIQLTNTPTSLAETVRYDEFERSLQLHSTGSDAHHGRRPDAIFHGQGVAGDEKIVHANLVRFFQAVEQEVTALVSKQRVPLLLAGVATDQGLYRQVNRYPKLLDQGIPGNPDRTSLDTLHEAAWAIVAPLFQYASAHALAHYHQLAGQGEGHTMNEIKNVVLAAVYHQIDMLFVTPTSQIWGKFIPEGHQVVVHKTREPGDEELVNLAVMHTLYNHGTAYLVAPEQLSDTTAVAAILRF